MITQSISRGKLNRMLKYFKGKLASITFEYNNSLGHHNIRKYEGEYNNFRIDVSIFSYETIYYFKLFLNDKIVFELDLPGHSEFHGLGKIRYINSGPSCYFEIGFL